ncbi:hypothetical protein B0T24DRAFT_617165, partial [Lasiosphaeria ovina]
MKRTKISYYLFPSPPVLILIPLFARYTFNSLQPPSFIALQNSLSLSSLGLTIVKKRVRRPGQRPISGLL